jgi:hypothetical protein
VLASPPCCASWPGWSNRIRAMSGSARPPLPSVFLDPAERELYPEWERALAHMVAGFRASVGTATDDPALRPVGR